MRLRIRADNPLLHSIPCFYLLANFSNLRPSFIRLSAVKLADRI